MKLRNKKTGEIVEPTSVEWVADDEITFAYTTADDYGKALSYHSLAEFNEEWEDLNRKEPLIKDDSMQQEIIDLNNRVAKLERQTAESQSHIPEPSIGKWC